MYLAPTDLSDAGSRAHLISLFTKSDQRTGNQNRVSKPPREELHTTYLSTHVSIGIVTLAWKLVLCVRTAAVCLVAFLTTVVLPNVCDEARLTSLDLG